MYDSPARLLASHNFPWKTHGNEHWRKRFFTRFNDYAMGQLAGSPSRSLDAALRIPNQL